MTLSLGGLVSPGDEKVDAEVTVEPLPLGSGPIKRRSIDVWFPADYDHGDNPVRVGGALSYKMSGDYKSIGLELRCEPLAKATIEDMAARNAQAFAFMAQSLNMLAPLANELAKAINCPETAPRGALDTSELGAELKRAFDALIYHRDE